MLSEINSEADVKREVKKLLTNYGWFYWMPAGSAYGKNNVDFNALKNDMFLAIETKYGKNKPTVNQLKFMKNIDDNGGATFRINETNLSALEGYLITHKAIYS